MNAQIKQRIGWLTLVTRFSILLLCAVGSVLAATTNDEKHVVLITIDGFPADMFQDPKTPVPRIRQLAAQGVSAEGMKVANPTVTWPNHTTLVTGVRPNKHSVLFNGILVRGEPSKPVAIDPKRDKSELVSVPTLFDIFHAQNWRTSAIDWPCTRNSPALDDDFPDTPDNVLHTTPRLRRELVAEGILRDETDVTFRALTGPERDDIWTKAACFVIRQYRPHLLLIHLLNTDNIHHRYGPQSPASYTALALADSYVGRIVDSLDSTGIRAQTTIFVVADHGFASATNLLQPNVLLRQAGLLEIGVSNRIAKAQVQVIPEGGTAIIYLNNPATREEDRHEARNLFKGRGGIADIIEPDQYQRLGLPLPERNPGMGELLLVPQDGYAFSDSAATEDFVVPITGNVNVGYHGYVASNPKMDALFLAAGRGIRPGVKIGYVDNVDVAPTIAHLFGQSLPNSDGRVLTEILLPVP